MRSVLNEIDILIHLMWYNRLVKIFVLGLKWAWEIGISYNLYQYVCTMV